MSQRKARVLLSMAVAGFWMGATGVMMRSVESGGGRAGAAFIAGLAGIFATTVAALVGLLVWRWWAWVNE